MIELDAFCAAQAWTPHSDNTEITAAHGNLQDTGFEIMARRYQNAGSYALKAVFYRSHGGKRRLAGILGCHPNETQPYVKLTDPQYDEADLYQILESSLV